MADKTGYQGVLDPQGVPIPLLLHDNGDGTYSLSIAQAGGSGGTVGGGCVGLIDVEAPIFTPEQIRDDGHERPNPGPR